MEDRGVVAAVVGGDPRGLAAAYDKYADRLHAFCISMLRDPDVAADALHDTFVVASQRAGQLRDPDRFRPWLYAIARNECLRQLRARRGVTVLDGAAQPRDGSADRDLREDELRSLVWEAVGGLAPRERSAIELSLRHGLAGADLADALGVSNKHMNAVVSRARQQFERSLSVLLIARTGRADCATLASLLAGSSGELSVPLRKRVTRHVEQCATCSAHKHQEVSAASLLTALPLIGAPFGLRRRVLNDAGDVRLAGYRKQLSGRAAPFNGAGFPVRFDSVYRPLIGNRQQWSRVAVIIVVLMLGGSLVWQLNGNPAGRTVTADPRSGQVPVPGAPQQADPQGKKETTKVPLVPPTSAPGVMLPASPAAAMGPTGTSTTNGTGILTDDEPSTGPSTAPSGGRATAGGGPGPGQSQGPPGDPGDQDSPAGATPTPSPSDSDLPGLPPPGGGTQPPRGTQPPSGSPSAPAGPGQLIASTTSIDLGDTAVRAAVKLRAKGGAVAGWTASVSSGVLAVRPASGSTIASGSTVRVRIRLDRVAAQQAQLESATVTFTYPSGSVQVHVSWDNAATTAPTIGRPTG